MIKCLIFDCDGTLVDSEYLCNLGLEIKLKEYRITESANDMMARFRGGKLASILEALEEKHGIQFNDEFIPSYRKIVSELFDQKLEPFRGVVEMLESISLPKCVASSGPLAKIKQSLSLTSLSPYFGENIYSSYEVGSWKPDPGLFLFAAKDMGFEPEECLVIEDSLVGIEAAKSAKMHSVLYDPGDEYKDHNIAYKISDMRMLQHIISDI